MSNDKMFLKLAPTLSQVLSKSPPSPPKKTTPSVFSSFLLCVCQHKCVQINAWMTCAF